MRIIAGKFRSRPLRSLRGLDLRPTADRLRETLFDLLTAGNPDALGGSIWFDLYAGTGAVGIEAISRGAAMVYFVESARRASELIRQNLRSLSIGTGFDIVQQDVLRALRRTAERGVLADFIFIDPPYRMQDAYWQTLELISELQPLKSTGMVIVEHQKKFEPGEKIGDLGRYRKLVQGDAALSFYRL